MLAHTPAHMPNTHAQHARMSAGRSDAACTIARMLRGYAVRCAVHKRFIARTILASKAAILQARRYVGHTYAGHGYTGHAYVGHHYTGHNYIYAKTMYAMTI